MSRKIIFLSIAAGLSFWVIDAAADFLFFYEGSFLDLLIFDVPRQEFYIRLLVLAIFVVFGVLISRVLAERRQAEEALREAEREKAIVLDSMSELVAYQDMEMRVLWANRAAGESVGVAPERLVGRRCYEVWNQRSEPCVGCPVEKARETGQPQEAEMTSPDGRVWLIRGYPTRDANGEMVGIVEVTLEVTERKRTEEALKKSEATLNSIFRAAPIGIGLVSNRVFVWVNDTFCKMVGYSSDELIGKSARILYLSDEEFDRVGRDKYAQVREWGTGTIETRLKHKDGGVIDVLLGSSAINPADLSAGITLTALDITERKQAEEDKDKMQAQLLQSQKMEAIGRLASGVAHDFNNLLTTITGYSGLLLSNLDDGDPLREDAEEIIKAAKRAASLTHQLLAFSRQQVFQPRVLDINALVTDIGKMLRRLIGEDVELITNLGPGLGRVKADPGQIEQVVMNLTVNARDAMPQGGRLTVKTDNVNLDEGYCKIFPQARPGRFVCLSVEDTGIGIDKETLQYIFEPFFSTREEGTGLGLAVAYGLVKQHEGWINVYSEPGQGSTFRVYLPAFSVEPEDEVKETTSLQELQGRGERILLVEDEEVVREYTMKALDRNGYFVFEAANVQEALDIFEREGGKFQLALSDVVLPDGTGLQLIDQLLSRNPELSVLLSSGYTDRKSQWPLIRERGIRFLQKPYALPDLLRAIRGAMESS
jgi:two-component system cell cycle sensor histidine kinase/response regulator CckA